MNKLNETQSVYEYSCYSKASDIDKNYFPEVIQVIPNENYDVYVYFDDGRIKLFNAKELVKSGVFKVLQDKELFLSSCTVLNGTLAWDIDGTFSEEDCLDFDAV